MKLYIGGAYQGQEELARLENEGAEIFCDFHETIRGVLARGEDAREFARAFCAEHPQAVVVCNEVGAGIVPVKAEERAWREGVGRAMCILAQYAGQVTRVTCGLGARIK